MNSRRLLPYLAVLVLIAFGPIGEAVSAQPAPKHESPAEATRALLDSTRGQKARTGLGLPHYKELLGRKWDSKVKKADAAFAAQLASPAAGKLRRSAAADDPLGASDSLKGIKGKQTRKLRIQTALDSLCPTHNPGVDADGYFEIKGKARGEHVVTTVERIGRYDVTTTVILDVRFDAHSQTTGAALYGIAADRGQVSITRSQTARDRRTGKKRKTGPTQRYSEALSPLFVLDGDFEEFIAQQDRDESPAPRRRLRSAAWDDLAQRFVAVVYNAIALDYAAAERHFQTPNTCVEMTVSAPEFLAPGGKVGLHGVPRLKQGTATEDQILGSSRFLVDYVNPQGQSFRSLAGPERFKPGEDWIEFTAPAQAWPASPPMGVKLILRSGAGVAEADATFRVQDSKVYFRVLDASITSNWSAYSDDHFCGRISGSQRFGGGFAQKPFSQQNEMHSSQGRWLGFVTGYVNGAWTDHHVQGCKTNELGQRVPCSEHLPDATPRPDGTWPFGFQIVQPAGSSELELRWRLLPATVGYIEPDEDECFVYLEGRVPAAETVRRIPAEQLLGTQPVTLTFSGSYRETGVEGFDYSWTYTMTIQRVGADGQPLG
ncbi:MAG: hypothetical protein M3340_02110 [Actinomycetota bacterium]|nr:hypothetical protein [Actinomycetota bacterium]